MVFAAVGLASCTAPTAEPSDTPAITGDLESVSPRNEVVVFWYPYTQRQEETMLAMVDEFNASNEWNITVIGEYAGTTDTIYDKIQDRIGGGELPGIVIAERYQAEAYASLGISVALDPYLENEQWGYTQEEVEDLVLDEARPQFEERNCWPLDVSFQVLYYNEDWLTELGYTQPPATWEEFEEMACAASEPGTGSYGYELSANASTFASLLLNRGGQILTADGQAYALDSREALETLTFIQELVERECAVLRTTLTGDRRDFAEGRVLFTIGSTTDLPAYRDAVAEEAGFRWSITTLPTSLEAPTVFAHGSTLSILKATPEKQLAAWLFLKWVAQPEQQARWARTTSALPIRTSAVILLEDAFADNPRYGKASGFLAYDVLTEPAIAGYDACRDTIAQMLRSVAGGEDPAVLLTSTEVACNALAGQTGGEGRTP